MGIRIQIPLRPSSDQILRAFDNICPNVDESVTAESDNCGTFVTSNVIPLYVSCFIEDSGNGSEGLCCRMCSGSSILLRAGSAVLILLLLLLDDPSSLLHSAIVEVPPTNPAAAHAEPTFFDDDDDDDDGDAEVLYA